MQGLLETFLTRRLLQARVSFLTKMGSHVQINAMWKKDFGAEVLRKMNDDISEYLLRKGIRFSLLGVVFCKKVTRDFIAEDKRKTVGSRV